MRLKDKGSIQGFAGLPITHRSYQGSGLTKMCFKKVRLQGQQSVSCGDGFGIGFEFAQSAGAKEVNFTEFRIDLQCLVEAIDAFLVTQQRRQGHPLVAQRRKVVRLDAQRLLAQGQCFVVPLEAEQCIAGIG